MTRSPSEVAVCCSSASERCPRASASSRVRASSCFFNSISELGPSLTYAAAFAPVERSLRPRVGLFAPLRDKVTSSAQPLVPPPGRPSQGWSLSILTEPRDELAPFHTRSPRRRYSRNGIYGKSSRSLRPRLHPYGLMLAARITLPHFSVSSAMNFPNWAGDPGSGVPPRSARRTFILGSSRAALTSLLSWSTISAGVAFGTPRPYQLLPS